MKNYKIGGIHGRERVLNPFKYWSAVSIVSAIIAIALLIFAYVDTKDSESTVGRTTTASLQSSTVTHVTDYFSFKTDIYWSLDETASTDKVFYYRKNVKGDFRGSLKIAVDTKQSLFDRSVPYVLPITQDQDSYLLTINEPSPDCSTLTPETAKAQRQEINYLGAVFYCTPDNVTQAMVLSLVNGSDTMLLSRPSGGTASYFIRYDSTSFDGVASEILPIIKTFKVL